MKAGDKLAGLGHRLHQMVGEEVSRMLFKRRKPPTFWESFRVWIWPRRSWLRSTQYVSKRILRITATPYAIAAGVGVGVFTSFTPLMGLHFLLAALIAWLVRGNLIASALGTFFGNPLSFPLIWAATYSTGHFILGTHGGEGAAMAITSSMGTVLSALWQFDLDSAGQALEAIWQPLLYPMLIGGFLLGPLFGFPAYLLTKRATRMFRERRRDKLLEKAANLKERAADFAQRASGHTKAAE